MNFALPDWLWFGGQCAELYRRYKRTSAISFEQVVLDCCQQDLNPANAPDLYVQLQRIHDTLQSEMAHIVTQGVTSTEHVPEDITDRQCSICKYDVYLAYVKCGCRSGNDSSNVVCLQCYDQLCECAPQKRTVCYRLPSDELERLVVKVKAVAGDTSPSPQYVGPAIKLSPAAAIAPSAPQHFEPVCGGAVPEPATLEATVYGVIAEYGIDQLTTKQVRRHSETQLGLKKNALRPRAEEILTYINAYIDADMRRKAEAAAGDKRKREVRLD